MNPAILVVGSSNTDMVIKTDHLPAPGETILGGTFFMNAGGKGANQAVAAARLGGNVSFIAKIGDDIFGRQSLQLFREEGIDISHITYDKDHPSGVALITVDAKGENCIAVASGANATLTPADLETTSGKIHEFSIILMQLEIPLAAVDYVLSFASGSSTKVILNPAPASPLSDKLLSQVSILTPNKTEAEMLTNIPITDVDSAKNAAWALRNKGVPTVIITLGAKGALVHDESKVELIAAPLVQAVDTTAAGDVFNGALAVALTEGKDVFDATEFACRAAALSVTKMGAQSSIPSREKLEIAKKV